jgi:excisionase family DNA binding protein
MPQEPEMLTVKRAAEELGLSPVSIRHAVMRGALEVKPLGGRTYLVSREEVERYRREHLRRCGKRMLPDEALTEEQRKQRAYSAGLLPAQEGSAQAAARGAGRVVRYKKPRPSSTAST